MMGLNVMALSVNLLFTVITLTEGVKLKHMDLRQGVLTEKDYKNGIDIDINNGEPNEKDMFDVAMKKRDGNFYSAIRLTEEQRKIISGEIGLSPILEFAKRWPKRIPYTIPRGFSSNERSKINQAIAQFNAKTCIRFVPKTNEKHFIHITRGRRRWSYVGKIGGRQYLSLGPRRVDTIGTPLQGLMHSLGFMPEHTRSDRDRYVSIMFANIMPGYESFFQKCGRCHDESSTMSESYDKKSLLHYSSYAYSANGRKTIISRSNPDEKLGRTRSLSAIDIRKITKMYSCA